MHAYLPNPPLRDFVELFWLYESLALPHAQERLMPSGTMELVINLREEESLFVGAHSESHLIDTSRERTILGVHFRPGGAFPFLRGIPAGELHNTVIGLDAIWSAAAVRELRERLLTANTPQAKFAILEQALVAQARSFERHRAVAYGIARLDRLASVAEVTDAVGLSSRRFIETFARETGYTPKLYARVRRFQRVLRRVHLRADVDWSEVALACGYYDQPHFNRDFRAFSGINPSAYLAQRSEHLNHVPVKFVQD